MKKPTQFETWEDVCEALGIDPVTSLAWAENVPAEDKAPLIAFFKLSKLSKAAYEGKQPDWSDEDEYKYWPYFYMNDENGPAGFGFSYSFCGRWFTNASVGSRLCYPTRAMAEHAGKHFIDWYRDLMVLPQIEKADEKAN